MNGRFPGSNFLVELEPKPYYVSNLVLELELEVLHKSQEPPNTGKNFRNYPILPC
jgi:hypothetical protein